VDSIGSFREHFSMKELLDAIDMQIVFANWIEDIKNTGGLSEVENEIISMIRKYFFFMIEIEPELSEKEFPEESADKRNLSLVQKFRQWENNVDESQLPKYYSFEKLLFLLLQLGDYAASYEDEEIIYDYILRLGVIKKERLEIRHVGANRKALYYGEKLVMKIPDVDSKFFKRQELVYVASHPDTGYIGINKEGVVVNRSAFMIDKLERKAVKVCMNQIAYVILLENGELVHNLQFSELPKAPVKNVELHGQQLLWQLME